MTNSQEESKDGEEEKEGLVEMHNSEKRKTMSALVPLIEEGDDDEESPDKKKETPSKKKEEANGLALSNGSEEQVNEDTNEQHAENGEK